MLIVEKFESRSCRGVLDTTLCDKVCQWLTAGRGCSPGNPISSTNQTDRHDITGILLKVVLNTKTHPLSNLRIIRRRDIHFIT